MVGDILQPTHLLFILVVALLVLGPKRLPEVGRSLGRGLRDFRSAMSETREEVLGAVNMDHTPVAEEPAEAPASTTTAEVTAQDPEPIAAAKPGP